MKKFILEFKDFISKGNVLDMAIGIIIGGAFGKIVTSLVENILMPLFGILLGGVNFSDLKLNVGSAEIKYGLFIQNIVDFLIISLVIFICIKKVSEVANSKFRKKKEEVEEPTEKICPFCKTTIAIDATRCPNCTSHLEEEIK